MKKWKVQVVGTTTIEVEAENYDDAINKVKAKTLCDDSDLIWNNYQINTKTLEVIDEND